MTLRRIVVLLLVGYPVPAELLDPRFPAFLQRAGGLSLTLLITAFSLLLGTGIGLAFALFRRNLPRTQGHRRLSGVAAALRLGTSAVVLVVRGLPIMVIVLLTFHLPYRIAEVRVPAFVLATAAFSVYAGVYLSETMRSGFQSIDAGVREAGRVLGLTPTQILIRLELPLVWRTMFPDFVGLAVTVFKDTSTLAIVAVPELTYVGRQMLMSEPVNYGLVLFVILLLYWAPAAMLSGYAARFEQSRASRWS
jgi:ABC-type amino acid transport system permease subunit